MIIILDTPQDLEKCQMDLNGYKTEQLLTPLTRYRNRHPKQRFAIDNGAFSKFNRKSFESLLERESERKHLCRFVAVPDVVGSARRTLEVFDYWFPRLCDWPLALVAQDGQEDLPIPWELIDAIFIGGSTKWKESDAAKQIVKAGKAMEKRVHVGRVNSRDRFTAFEEWGADSCDGSGIARYTWQREKMTADTPLFTRQEMIFNVE
jgi:hypothetical protein